MKKECLQAQTGSCAGCNVLAIAEKRANREGRQTNEAEIVSAAREVQASLCPDGRPMQTHLLNPEKPSIW